MMESNQDRTTGDETLVNTVGLGFDGQFLDVQPEVMPHKPSSATTGAPASGCGIKM